jgi:hypothetical protein
MFLDVIASCFARCKVQFDTTMPTLFGAPCPLTLTPSTRPHTPPTVTMKKQLHLPLHKFRNQSCNKATKYINYSVVAGHLDLLNHITTQKAI